MITSTLQPVSALTAANMTLKKDHGIKGSVRAGLRPRGRGREAWRESKAQEMRRAADFEMTLEKRGEKEDTCCQYTDLCHPSCAVAAFSQCFNRKHEQEKCSWINVSSLKRCLLSFVHVPVWLFQINKCRQNRARNPAAPKPFVTSQRLICFFPEKTS